MEISPRNTKAEILAAYHQQAALLRSGPSWPQVADKIAAAAACVTREVRLMVTDCYGAGRQARVWYDQAMGELCRPIIKS